MEINIGKILYLFLRLSPFIVVCYFTLLSVFNQDIKGLIYLAGLMFTCFLTLGLNKYFENDTIPIMKMECRITSLGANDESLSKIPLGILTLSYTFAYLAYIIGTYSMVNSNIPIFVIFPLLLLTEGSFQLKHGCTQSTMVVIALIFGAFCGYIWGLIIDSTGYTDLQLFNSISTRQVCDRPSATKYRCRIVKR
tara:strand:+ start:1639 stop:2220 length:582 start_codon:yes stop_codon:yes gene_type:complete